MCVLAPTLAGGIIELGDVTASGTLTIHLDGTFAGSHEILLFSFASFQGGFDEIVIDGYSTCGTPSLSLDDGTAVLVLGSSCVSAGASLSLGRPT
jgi:hypothetical protein